MMQQQFFRISTSRRRKPRNAIYFRRFNRNHRTNIQAFSKIENESSPLTKNLNLTKSCFVILSSYLVPAICTCVCLWQLSERVKHYLDEPITFEVNVIRQNEVEFPAFTFCPARLPFDDRSLENSSSDMSTTRFSLNDAWGEYELKVNENVEVLASCNEDQSVCDFDEGVVNNVNTTVSVTYFGNCLTILPGLPMEYRGSSTYFFILFKPGKHVQNHYGQDIVGQFYFQESDKIRRHEAYYLIERMKLYEEFIARLVMKQFNFLNISKNPCDDEATVVECKNRCVDRALDEIVNCSLPFMISKWPGCKTLREAKLVMEQSMNFYQYFSFARCSCRRQCTEKLYSYTYNSVGQEDDDLTSLLVQYSDNILENITEINAYTFPALLSDFGGELGLFLGISGLSLFNELSIVLVKFIRKKNVRRAPRQFVR